MLDLIIIGLGPAGLSAAIYAARYNLKCIAISKDVGGMANLIPDIENYPGHHYISGFDLVRRFQENLQVQKMNIKTEEDVRSVKKTKNGFAVITNMGRYEARCLVVCSGRRFKRLKNVRGSDKFENKGLSYCAVCDGPLFKGKTVAVIGGGRAGILSTLFLMPIAKKIFLIEIGKKLSAPLKWRNAVQKADNVEVLLQTKTIEVRGNDVIKSIVVKQKSKKTLNVEGVFVEIGYTPNAEFLRNLVKMNKRGEIIVDKENKTSCDGIFAAGDCTDILEKQVVVATGEGAKAALSALEYLELNE